MKLSIVRGGGVGGFLTRTELDTNQLPPGEASAFEAQLREAGELADAPTASRLQPDELSYELTVEDESGKHSARYTESSLPEPVRSLIAWTDARPERTTALEPSP